MNLKRLDQFPERVHEWIALAQQSGVWDEQEFAMHIQNSLVAKTLESGQAFFLEKEGAIIATCFLQKTEYDTPYSLTVFHVAVLSDLRGMGIGKQLMEMVFAHASKLEKHYISLFTTTQSAFYIACGMLEYGSIPGFIEGDTRYFFYKQL